MFYLYAFHLACAMCAVSICDPSVKIQIKIIYIILQPLDLTNNIYICLIISILKTTLCNVKE